MNAGEREQLEVQLSAYLDGELTPAEQAEVEALLLRDAKARQLLEELRAVIDATHGLPRARAAGDLREAIRSQLERHALLGTLKAPVSQPGASLLRTRWVAAAAIVLMTSVAGYITWSFMEVEDNSVGAPSHYTLAEKPAAEMAKPAGSVHYGYAVPTGPAGRSPLAEAPTTAEGIAAAGRAPAAAEPAPLVVATADAKKSSPALDGDEHIRAGGAITSLAARGQPATDTDGDGVDEYLGDTLYAGAPVEADAGAPVEVLDVRVVSEGGGGRLFEAINASQVSLPSRSGDLLVYQPIIRERGRQAGVLTFGLTESAKESSAYRWNLNHDALFSTAHPATPPPASAPVDQAAPETAEASPLQGTPPAHEFEVLVANARQQLDVCNNVAAVRSVRVESQTPLPSQPISSLGRVPASITQKTAKAGEAKTFGRDKGTATLDAGKTATFEDRSAAWLDEGLETPATSAPAPAGQVTTQAAPREEKLVAPEHAEGEKARGFAEAPSPARRLANQPAHEMNWALPPSASPATSAPAEMGQYYADTTAAAGEDFLTLQPNAELKANQAASLPASPAATAPASTQPAGDYLIRLYIRIAPPEDSAAATQASTQPTP